MRREKKARMGRKEGKDEDQSEFMLNKIMVGRGRKDMV